MSLSIKFRCNYLAFFKLIGEWHRDHKVHMYPGEQTALLGARN